MGAEVRVEVIASAEHLATHSTFVRPETRVKAHVSGQHVRAREGAVANLAQMYFVAVTWTLADYF
jgi:hypothetical protein